MREILFEYLRGQEEAIIYGCGNNGLFLQWLLKRHNVKVDCMCDSNEKLWGTTVNGIECISPVQLKEHKEALVIIGIDRYEEVLKSIKNYQLKKIITWNQIKFLLKELEKYPDDLADYRKFLLDRKPELKQRLADNSKYKNIHEGKRCFIVGNGPSVKNLNLSLLRDEFTFTVNQMARNPQFHDIHTNYHLWADSGFFNTNLVNEGDYKLLEIMKSLSEDVDCFFPYEVAHEYVEKFELEKYIHVNYFSFNACVNGDEPIDFTGYIRGGYTVVQYAIRLAIYMGFKEIYILGCECTTILNVINSRLADYSLETHCYDIDEKEKERARKMYMRMPMQMYYKSEYGVLEEYHVINEHCKQAGILIYNCTPGGLLEELPRCSFEKALGKEMNKEADSCSRQRK